jgi:hypothetical protein
MSAQFDISRKKIKLRAEIYSDNPDFKYAIVHSANS